MLVAGKEKYDKINLKSLEILNIYIYRKVWIFFFFFLFKPPIWSGDKNY